MKWNFRPIKNFYLRSEFSPKSETVGNLLTFFFFNFQYWFSFEYLLRYRWSIFFWSSSSILKLTRYTSTIRFLSKIITTYTFDKSKFPKFLKFTTKFERDGRILVRTVTGWGGAKLETAETDFVYSIMLDQTIADNTIIE